MKGRAAAGIVALTLLGGAAPRDDIARVQGVYRLAFTNHMADGEAYRSVDELTIRRRGPGRADVSVHLEFRNGHSCDFSQTTTYEAGTFRVTSDPRSAGGGTCAFSLTVLSQVLRIGAEGEGCNAYCGMRGRLDGAQFERSLRRPAPRRR